MYFEGKGVSQDFQEAIKWYRKAAEQGNASTQFNLGLMYAEGKGVPQDFFQAYFWFNLAAKTGDMSALQNRDIISTEMTPEEIEEAQLMARMWTEKYK